MTSLKLIRSGLFFVKGIRVVSNGGGINPHACAAALSKACQKAGVEMNIAVITGDDLMDRVRTNNIVSVQLNYSKVPPLRNSIFQDSLFHFLY